MKLLFPATFICLASAIKQDYSCAGHQTAQFPHPTSCNKYVYCVHGIAYTRNCPDELQYDRESNSCEYKDEVNCDAAYLEAGLQLCKNKLAGKYPKANTQQYIECDGSGGFTEQNGDCGAGHKFDVLKSACGGADAKTLENLKDEKDIDVKDLIDRHTKNFNVKEARGLPGGGSGKKDPEWTTDAPATTAAATTAAATTAAATTAAATTVASGPGCAASCAGVTANAGSGCGSYTTLDKCMGVGTFNNCQLTCCQLDDNRGSCPNHADAADQSDCVFDCKNAFKDLTEGCSSKVNESFCKTASGFNDCTRSCCRLKGNSGYAAQDAVCPALA